jgi:RHS repeat-associated protein
LTSLKDGNHISQFSYNKSDKLIKSIDYLGLVTNYTYHPVHGKPTLIQCDPTIQEFFYDDFGREIIKKDAYGAKTQIEPNSYGDPKKIIYPDGGEEHYTYAPNGLLIESVDPDNLKTTYSYDPLGRLIMKKEGIYQTTYHYDGYHLIETSNPIGVTTHYTYNLHGQKVSEDHAGVETKYTYDTLGFLSSTSRSGRKISYHNDVLGNTLEKIVDGILRTIYSYDAAGNISSISQGNPIYFFYDSYDRLVEKIDAEGHRTVISYEEGDQILTKKITNPKGIETIETYNAHGLLLKREIPGSSSEKYVYDKALRLRSQDQLTFTYTPGGLLSSMNEGDQRITYWTYTPGGKIASKIKPDGTIIFYEYDDQSNLKQMGSRKFKYDPIGRLIGGTGFTRVLDSFGNILEEKLETGLIITSSYDDWNRPIQRILPDSSRILYEYEGPFLKTIKRLDEKEKTIYTHTYNQFDEKGNLLVETGLFNTIYSYDKNSRRTFQKNSHFEERLSYDPSGNLIQKGNCRYSYDNASQLISEKNHYQITYDEHLNRIYKNGEIIPIDALNQRKDATYDPNGNLIKNGFVYDEFDQLVQTGTDSYRYDALGRRLSSKTTSYFYIEDEEIGSYENGQIKELKVLGTTAPIAVEINGKPYAPVVDVQNTIRQLIDWETGKLAFENSCDAFGEGLSEEIPYAYVGKRYDSSSGLIYFGKRFYDPCIGRWLTPDPLGPVDHSNLYQYVFNNPFKYYDPNGESLGGCLLGLGEMILGGTLILTGGVLEIASFGAYTVGCGFQVGAGAALIEDGLIRATVEAQDLSFHEKARIHQPDRDQIYWTNGFFISPIPGEHSYDFLTRFLKSKHGSEHQNDRKYKKPKSGISGKEGAKDVPSWAKGSKPYENESGKEFAKRLMDEKYGSGNYDKGPRTPFSQIKKWGDRSWE